MNDQTKVLENRSVTCSNGSKIFRVIKVFVKKKIFRDLLQEKSLQPRWAIATCSSELVTLRAMYASIPGELVHKEN